MPATAGTHAVLLVEVTFDAHLFNVEKNVDFYSPRLLLFSLFPATPYFRNTCFTPACPTPVFHVASWHSTTLGSVAQSTKISTTTSFLRPCSIPNTQRYGSATKASSRHRPHLVICVLPQTYIFVAHLRVPHRDLPRELVPYNARIRSIPKTSRSPGNVYYDTDPHISVYDTGRYNDDHNTSVHHFTGRQRKVQAASLVSDWSCSRLHNIVPTSL